MLVLHLVDEAHTAPLFSCHLALPPGGCLPIADLGSLFHDMQLEPLRVLVQSPCHNDMKPIENRPDAIKSGSRAKLIRACHYL